MTEAAQVTPAVTPKAERDDIKRTTGPQTTDGRRWEVQLNGMPSAPWLALFKEESTVRTLPQRVEFDRASAVFKSDEAGVEQWIASIDKWIATTNARHLMVLEAASRALHDRFDAATKEKERIERMNDRFKNL